MRLSIRTGVRQLFRLMLGRPADARRDADDELAAHLEERAQAFAARGMPIEDARAEALRRLGGSPDEVRETLRRSAETRERRIGTTEHFEGIRADVRYAMRGLRREPTFSVFAILTLALGIGANAAMFGIVDRLLVRGPEHVVDPGRVVRLFWTMREPAGDEVTSCCFDRPVYPNLRAAARAFTDVALYTPADRGTLFTAATQAHFASRSNVTATFFGVLGVQPELGRFFTTAEQESTPPSRVVVLGFDLWHSDFGGDRAVLGRRVTIGSTLYTVIGVAPRGFTGVDLDHVDLWTPATTPTGASAGHWLPFAHSSGPRIIGRLKPGVAFADADADATAAHRRTYDGPEPVYADARISVGAITLDESGVESIESRISRWLVGLSAIVLLVACSNIANLLLARSVRREREMAVRLSLGAGRRRLMRLLLIETGLLTLLGGLAGLCVAAVAGAFVRSVMLPGIDWSGGVLSNRVLVFALVTTVVVGIVMGVGPGWRAGRANLMTALKTGGRDGGMRKSFVRAALTFAQTMLAMVLLVGAALFVESLRRVRHVDLGVEADRVVLLSPRWPSAPIQGPEFERADRFAALALERLQEQRGIEHAALTVGMPFGNSGSVSLFLPGRDSLPRLPGSGESPDLSSVTPEYFATVGTRLLRGRLFTNADRKGAAPVAIVGKTMAEMLWPGQEAVGQCMLVGIRTAGCTYVVGVVQDAHRRRVIEEPTMHYYLPLGQSTNASHYAQLLVRPRGDAAAAIPALRQLVRQIDPTLRYVDAATLQESINPQFRTWRVGATMFSLFAILAVIVATVGLFSVVAYTVEQRRHELGVRVALGARAWDVITLVVRGTVSIGAFGVASGAAVAVSAGRLAQPLLFQTDASDPAVLGGVGLLLVTVALLAAGVPALRARRVDPMTALREE